MADKTDDLVIGVSTDMAAVQRALKRLDSDIARTSGQIEKRFSSVGKSIDNSMTSAMQARIDAMTGVATKATKEWTGALAQQGQEMDRLRAKFSPVFSTITSYKTSINEIRTAHRLGAISADEMTAAITRERQAALASIAAIKSRNAALSDTPLGGGGGFNTANIAAQFQDIGVTTAMGMSPVQIALQQGTQLSAVFEQMKANGQSAGSAIAAAFTSIISPTSLVTIGLIAATAAAAQYFLLTEDGSEATAKLLQEQADLIQRVAQKWGEALPALKAYADEQQRLADEGEKAEATNALIAKSYEQVASVLPRLNSELSKFAQEASGGGWGGAAEDQATRLASAYDDVESAFAEFNAAIAENRDTTEEYANLQRALTAFTTSSAVPATGALRDVVYETADAYATAAAEAAAFANQAALAGARGPRMGAGKGDRTPGGPVTLREDEFASRFGYDEYFNFPKDKKPKKSAGARAAERDANAYRDLVKSAQDRIDQMRLEAELIGKTGVAADAYRMKLDLIQQATGKGRKISAEQRAELELLAETYGKVAEQVAAMRVQEDLLFERRQMFRSDTERRVSSQLRSSGIDPASATGQFLAGQIRLNEQLALGHDLAQDFARGFVDDLMNGVDAMDALANAAQRLGAKLLDMAMDQAIKSLFGNLLGGLGGGGGSWAAMSASGKYLFSSGGYTGPGGKNQPAGVVHKGEYVFSKASVDKIGLGNLDALHRGYANGGPVGISAPRMPRMQAQQAAPVAISYSPTIDARGADTAAVARLEQVIANDRKQFEARVTATVRKLPSNRQGR